MSGYVISIDGNQNEILEALPAFGIVARSVAGARGAGFDIIACKYGINLLVEIKIPGKRGDLRDSEKWMRDNWPGPFIIATSADEIAAWFDRMENDRPQFIRLAAYKAKRLYKS